MARKPDGGDELARLTAVQTRIRALARNHLWFAEAIRGAFKDQQALGWRYVAECKAMSKQEDGPLPANPHSVDPAELARFPPADYRTIALHRLGGLADLGSPRPIVPPPMDMHDVNQELTWRFRFPIDDADRHERTPALQVRAFPPDVAEQMLADVELWAKGEAARRGEQLVSGDSPMSVPSPERADRQVDSGALSQRLMKLAEKLEDVRIADDRQLSAALTHYAIDAGEVLMAAIDEGFLIVEEVDSAHLAEQREFHAKEQSIPSHRRFHRTEGLAAFTDYRVVYFTHLAARQLGLTELTRFDTTGTDIGQRRLMLAERARMLGHACREFTREVRENELRVPLWLRVSNIPREFAAPVRRELLAVPLPGPMGELCAMAKFAQRALIGTLEARVRQGGEGGATDPSIAIRAIVFPLQMARDGILTQLPAQYVPVANVRMERLIEATRGALDAILREPIERIVCAKSDCEEGRRHLLPGPCNAAMSHASEATEEVFTLSRFTADALRGPLVSEPGANDSSVSRPPMKRPVLIADAARAISKRPDLVLRALRRRKARIDGPDGAYLAEFDDICMAYPKKMRQLVKWASVAYPVAENG